MSNDLLQFARRGSLIAQIALDVRPLPVALGQAFAVVRMGDAKRLELLHRHFRGLSLAHQMECKAELHHCKQARRGASMAVVS